MEKKKAEIIVLIIILAIAVLLGLNTDRYFFRLDLTEGRIFTISKTSRTLFQEIPDRVYITYFISDKLRYLYNFPMEIEDMLNEYAAFSRGKIKVTVLDPVNSGSVSEAEALGVFPQQIEVIEKDERSFARVYSGIVIQYLDRYETLPVVARTDNMEYDLTSRIRKIVSNEERVVGILIGDSDKSMRENFGSLAATLSGDFTVKEIEKGEDIPDEVNLLLVFGNKDLDEFDLFPVDQFIMKGGRALFAVEGVRVDFSRGWTAGKIEDSPLLDMLSDYGVEVKREQVLDTYSQNFRIPRQFLGQTMWEVLDKYPHWITVAEQFASRDNPVTARFSGLDLYWASPLEPVERENVSAEVLMTTTPEAWTMADHFENHPERATMLLYMDHDTKGQYPLAVALRGSFSSFFKGKGIPTREGEKIEWKEVKESSPETRLIVIGDSEFASEFYQFTDARYNLDFVSQSAEWLSNSEDLLLIKTRATRDMRLNKIRDPEEKWRAAFFAQIFNVVFIPLLVIAFGLARLFYRRKKSISVEQEGFRNV